MQVLFVCLFVPLFVCLFVLLRPKLLKRTAIFSPLKTLRLKENDKFTH